MSSKVQRSQGTVAVPKSSSEKPHLTEKFKYFIIENDTPGVSPSLALGNR